MQGQNVLITGAAGHLAQAVAAEFAKRGARLALLARQHSKLQAIYGRGDGDAGPLLLEADLLDPKQTCAVVQTTVDTWGSVNVLCNIAGGFRMGARVHETPAADWDFMHQVNVMTLVHTVQAVVPHMLAAGSGKIVNVGAYSARHGGARVGAYVASKSAVIRLTESMAAELRAKNINVNCVLPTIIDTPPNRASMPDADYSRWVDPADLASVIAFLASDGARAIHGAALPVVGLS